MNKLSKQTVSFIRETERGFQFTGSAIEFASHAFEGQSVNAMDVEAILTDITGRNEWKGDHSCFFIPCRFYVLFSQHWRRREAEKEREMRLCSKSSTYPHSDKGIFLLLLS